MNRTVIYGPRMVHLGAALARELGKPLCQATIDHFPDGEMRVSVSEGVAAGVLINKGILLSPTVTAVLCPRAR
jgi:phosphoribosylpyrophosphate synthetase